PSRRNCPTSHPDGLKSQKNPQGTARIPLNPPPNMPMKLLSGREGIRPANLAKTSQNRGRRRRNRPILKNQKFFQTTEPHALACVTYSVAKATRSSFPGWRGKPRGPRHLFYALSLKWYNQVMAVSSTRVKRSNVRR